MVATLIKTTQSHQALQVTAVDIPGGDSATFNLTSQTGAAVRWDNGGISWTIVEKASASKSFEVKVEHSLMPEGDAVGYWSPDPDSPFNGAVEGSEFVRISRIRFANSAGSDTVTVIVASNSKFQVDLS